jgi:phosphate transport system permease protein
MDSIAATTATAVPPKPIFAIHRRKAFLGLSLDQIIKVFFGGNAVVAVVVLALITIFLFREGYSFFGQNHKNIEVYRLAGLEYVDIIRGEVDDHTALTRSLSDLRLRQFDYYTKTKQMSPADANKALAPFDDFSGKFSDSVDPLRGMLSDLGDAAVATKTEFLVGQDKIEERKQLLEAGRPADAAKVVIPEVDFKAKVQPLIGTRPAFVEANHEFAKQLPAIAASAPAMPTTELQARLERFRTHVTEYVAGFPAVEHRLEVWNYAEPVPFTRAITTFIFGKAWTTASSWQDWYGVVPLFLGSLMVSFVALCLAVPLGIGAAIYINQIATARERAIIKPCIEFISAFPSVVLGFFGIAVLGQALRALSQVSWLSWFPGFPFAERLNILTAGCLLALIAVPTIFTLAEDAINNVPRAFKEASFALGATRFQTIIKIIVPASLSGIISAVLLGFGRVIGETMVVLLCAGNRIAIPDFSAGLGVITQPVHTMTGIIAQEMGEVVRGSIHYRALFVVGLVLFFVSLAINYAAQGLVRRYRISIG